MTIRVIPVAGLRLSGEGEEVRGRVLRRDPVGEDTTDSAVNLKPWPLYQAFVDQNS
jgi:hypothetical protein